nr:unnamed protein product [Callosobruchus chinensis]
MALTSGSGCSHKFISRRNFYEVIKRCGDKRTQEHITVLSEFVQTQTTCHDDSISNSEKKIKNFISQFRKELAYAAQMSLRSSGQTHAAKIVKDMTMTTQERAKKYSTAYKEHELLQIRKLPKSEALSMFIETNLTRDQYNKIRKRDSDRFPPYKEIQLTKKECYPQRDFFTISETTAAITLQGLLNHTAQRIIQTHSEVLTNFQDAGQLYMVAKWGFDGSSQQEYKQKFSANLEATDANIFIASLIATLVLALAAYLRGKESKEIVDTIKKDIHMKFRNNMGLILDKPKPGFGSSNDGNTARRFFHDHDQSAALTGVSADLIKRFKSLLPIGQLSEEAQEASNKVFRKFRESFSRKISREKTNEDILKRLLISSDPYISSLEKVRKLKKALDTEVIGLLKAAEVTEQDSNSSDSGDSGSD